jgi:hypothetical protein
VDPDIKMIVLVLPAILLQLLLPLLSMVVTAAYFRQWVLVYVAVVIAANAAVIWSPCLKRFLFCDLKRIYGKSKVLESQCWLFSIYTKSKTFAKY